MVSKKNNSKQLKPKKSKVFKHKKSKVVHSTKSKTLSARTFLYLQDWGQNCKRYWLTIDDILKLQPGESLEVLSLHRNVADYVSESGLKDGFVYNPTRFFHHSKATIWRINDQDLRIILKFDLEEHANDIEFDIKWKQWCLQQF